MGLGSAGTFSLAEARDKALTCRKLCYEGIDPIEMRRGQRQDAAIEAAKAITFRTCAERYIEAHKAGWRNAKHAAQWTATLEAYAFPVFGDLPVAAVDTGLVMQALQQSGPRSRDGDAGARAGRVDPRLGDHSQLHARGKSGTVEGPPCQPAAEAVAGAES